MTEGKFSRVSEDDAEEEGGRTVGIPRDGIRNSSQGRLLFVGRELEPFMIRVIGLWCVGYEVGGLKGRGSGNDLLGDIALLVMYEGKLLLELVSVDVP
jgi:hypothetical protein